MQNADFIIVAIIHRGYFFKECTLAVIVFKKKTENWIKECDKSGERELDTRGPPVAARGTQRSFKGCQQNNKQLIF